jgi:hypothetical protein
MAPRLAKVLVRISSMVDRRNNCGSESALYHALNGIGHDDNHLKECMKDAADMGKDIFVLP